MEMPYSGRLPSWPAEEDLLAEPLADADPSELALVGEIFRGRGNGFHLRIKE